MPNVEVIDKAGIFFTTTEVWFVIKANLNKHSIKRIAEDFQWLSNTVRKLYPLLAVDLSLVLGTIVGSGVKIE